MKRTVWTQGWWRPARRVRSPNFGPRPEGTPVTLAIVHSISLPPGAYGGDAVEHGLPFGDLGPEVVAESLRGLGAGAAGGLVGHGEDLRF